MNQKQLFSFLFLVGLLISIVFANRWQPNEVMSQNPTVPTPTPVGQPTNTPAPPPPATNTPNSGGGNTPMPATATHTPVVGTATHTSTPIPTPDGGIMPTAVPCDLNPTATASNRANVRSAPTTDAEIIYTFIVGETRRVIGRSDRVDWWVITLPDGTQGWVADIAVTINGYTGNLPIVPTTGNAQTPEPNTSWNPTPNPTCTDVPTVTPTATNTATPTATATPTTQTITATATITNGEGVATPTTTLEPEPLPNSATTDTGTSNNGRNEGYPAPTALSQGTGYPAITPTLIMPLSDTPEPIGYIPANPTSVPLDDGSQESGGLPNFIPIVGLLLIAGGVFAYMMNRRQK